MTQPILYEPPLPTREEPQTWPRIMRVIRTLLIFAIAGGVAGAAFGTGVFMSERFGLVVTGRSVPESIEQARDVGLGVAIIAAFLGILFAVIVWFDHPPRTAQPLVVLWSRKHRDAEAREALEKT